MTDKNIERHSALGSYHYAEDFHRAAVHMAEVQENGGLRLRFGDTVSYHLHMHSIELALKAFLRANGTTNDQLKRLYSHNLTTLLEKCTEYGISLGDNKKHTELVVSWLNQHGKAQTFRYFESGYFELLSILDVRTSNERILAVVKPICLSQETNITNER